MTHNTPDPSHVSTLATILAAEQQRTSYRALAERTGVSRGALEHLIQQRNTKLPELETLVRIADAYGWPMWRVIEMAGVDLDLPPTITPMHRLVAHADGHALLTRLVRIVEQLDMDISARFDYVKRNEPAAPRRSRDRY